MPDPSPPATWTLPPGWTVARVKSPALVRAARAAIFPEAFTEPGRVEIAAEYHATRRTARGEAGARARLQVETRRGETYVIGLKRESGAITFHRAGDSEPRRLEFHLPLPSVAPPRG